jgi:hypothetical protein
MRTSICAISALVLLALAGCRAGSSVSPNAPPTATQTSSPVVELTQFSQAAVTPTIANGFSICLLTQDSSPQQLASLSHLDLAEKPLLTIDDIISYRKATHEIELTAAGYDRIDRLSIPVNGKAFAVCVDGQPIYAGAFWVGYSSLSFDGVVIDALRASREQPVLQIQLGYPGADFFHGDDPRSDPKILQALEEAGKIR